MAILLLAEHDNSTLSDQTAKTLTAATRIGGDITILVAGSGATVDLRLLRGPFGLGSDIP